LGWKNEGTWTFEAHKKFEIFFACNCIARLCVLKEGGGGKYYSGIHCLKYRSFV
jgi:hypothetical protein